MRRWSMAVCGCILAGAMHTAHAAEVLVAVAANFTAPMQKIALLFEQDTGHKAQLAFGSTGRFYAQIRQGAPFQVLLAADDKTPDKLEKEGLAVVGSRRTYAVGKLVLWSKRDNAVDGEGAVLKSGRFAKIALADPKLAPYGAAAHEVLTRLGMWDSLQPKLVLGESIGQAYQFVASANADLGFVAMSQVYADGRLTQGSAWMVPPHLYAPIRQDAVLLRPGEGAPAALALLQYLHGDKARAVIRAYGYDL